MGEHSRVDFRTAEFLVKIEEISDEVLLASAYQILAESQPNVPVDVGFLKNSGYVIGKDTNTYSVSGELAAPPADIGNARAAVAYAAIYAIFQEARVHFLWGAAMRFASYAERFLGPQFASRL